MQDGQEATMEKSAEQRAILAQWMEDVQSYELPAWESLPTLQLYMDQVVTLVTGYLGFLSTVGEEKPLTSSMINNYVKLGLLRPPVKKRYTRAHLACLIMICLLKRALSMAALRTLLPREMDDAEIAGLYELFRASCRRAADRTAEQVGAWSDPFYAEGADDAGRTLVMRLALESAICKAGAEKII